MNDDPKIIVDEDWKAQVQAEKDALARAPESDATDAPKAEAESPATTAGPAAAAPQQEHPQIPAPTMSLLFSSLATQAMFALGRIPDPQTGKSEANLDEARHIIDTLQLLEEKTKGNLTPQEGAILTRLLHDLRMEYVAVRHQGPAGASTN
jgi:hypothetical protein